MVKLRRLLTKCVLFIWRSINSKLLYKMIIVYSLLTVIPLVLVSTIFYLRSKNTIETKLIESRTQALVETADKIDGVLKGFSDKINDIGESSIMINLLQNDKDPIKYPLDESNRKSMESTFYASINNEVYSEGQIENYMDAIYIMNTKGKVYATEGAQPIQFASAVKITPFQFNDKPEWAFYIDHRRMLSSKKILDSTTKETIGYALIMLKTDQVAKLYASYPRNTFYITNGSGVILSSDNPNQIGTLLQTDINKKIWVNKRQSDNRNFIYQNLVSIPALYKEISDLGYFAGVITLITLIIVLLLTITILRRITHPLRRLSLLMGKAELEIFEPITGIKTNDEVAQLGKSYNSLITEIKDLIGQVYKAELLKKEAQIKAIMMQMNPHFLYNTLETIGILAVSKDNIIVVPDMVQKLSRILRFSMATGNDYIPLKTEIQFAEWYIQIHQYRLGDRLACKINIPKELMPIKVPKLIIQPIIENAVLHGINQIDRPGIIQIRAVEMDYDLVLEVEDNGPGFGVKGKQPGMESQGLETGLELVKSRIQHLYGDKYGVSIVKTNSDGTIIRVQLPMLMNEEGE